MEIFLRSSLFELTYQVRRPLFLGVTFAVFLVGFALFATEKYAFGGPLMMRNAPYALALITGTFTQYGIVAVVIFLADAALRDTQSGIADLMRSTPANRIGYWSGRFVGAYLAATATLAALSAGLILATYMPWVDSERFISLRLADYLYAAAIIGLPNMLVASGLLFAAALATRALLPSFVAALALIALIVGTNILFNTSDESYRNLAALSDPIATQALLLTTRLWTPAELDTLYPLSDVLVLNRVLWLAVALVVSILAILAAARDLSFARNRSRVSQPHQTNRSSGSSRHIARGSAIPTSPSAPRQLLTLAWLDAKTTARGPIFIVLLIVGLLAALNTLLSSQHLVSGSAVDPTTPIVAQIVKSTFDYLLYGIVIFFSGEIVWRERQSGMGDIIEAMPVPNWAFVASKIGALWLIILLVVVIEIAMALLVQRMEGITRHHPEMYLSYFVAYQGGGFLLFAVLAVFLQRLGGNLATGMALTTLATAAVLALPRAGVSNRLLLFGQAPEPVFSEMVSADDQMGAVHVINLYWAGFALMFFVLACLIWSRGVPSPALRRLRSARPERWMLPVAAGGLALSASAGALVVRGTYTVNNYLPPAELEHRAVKNEQRFGHLRDLITGRFVDLKMQLDLRPKTGAFRFRGQYTIENRSGGPLERLHIAFHPSRMPAWVKLEGAQLESVDRELGYYIFRPIAPLAPGARALFTFEVKRERSRFEAVRGPTPVIENGTYLRDLDVEPLIGFNANLAVERPADRRKYDLAALKVPSVRDPTALATNGVRADSDLVRITSHIITDADQTAIVPGELQRTWIAAGRRHFVYQTPAPIVHVWAVNSGRYKVRHETWNGLTLEVFYHPDHGRNVDKMLATMKLALETFEREFGPFQFKQMRIIEKPFDVFAVSFAGTVPYTETFGFLMRPPAPGYTDEVLSTVAHEMAHQWWAHQVIPASVPGSSLVTEAMASYASYLVREQKFGRAVLAGDVRRANDTYLAGRQRAHQDVPLTRVWGGGAFAYYNKGPNALYALRWLVGPEAFTRATRRMVAEHRFRTRPYATADDFVRTLKSETPADYHEWIDDYLARVVLHEIKAERMRMKPLAAGKFQVEIDLSAARLVADERGREQRTRFSMPVEIAVEAMDGSGRTALFRTQVRGLRQTVRLITDFPPGVAIADPFNLLIERERKDNMVTLSIPGMPMRPN